MKIKNKWRSPLGVAVYASVALALAACSGNPVDETSASSKITASTKGAVNEIAKTPTKTVGVTVGTTQAKVSEVAASTAAMQKARQVKYKQALARKKHLENQRLSRSRQLASAARKQSNIRSPQPVATRSKQPVATRAPQPIKTRAPIRLAKANKWKPAIRKVAFNRKAKRPAISRITPNKSFGYALSNAAIERTKQRVRYDGKYVKIAYPWGDVPKSIGVCTDVVIRAYRKLGIDLQQEVHKDITQDFYAYPNLVKWGLKKADPNIDHRRVYNLQAFFKRHKAELPRSRNPRNYKPGDLVTWMVGPNFPHIGVVVNKPSKADPRRLMIAHNIGAGPQIEDILFSYPMTGHYRYTPQHRNIKPSLLYAKTPAPASVQRAKRNQGLSYAELLQVNKILSGSVQARSVVSRGDLLTKNTKAAKPQEKIMLAHLDASVFNDSALKALIK